MRVRIIFVLTLFFLGTTTLSAQKSDSDPEKELKALKVAFLTKYLNLSKTEAKKFWPLYDRYWDKKNAIFKERNAILESYSTQEADISDREILSLSDRYVNTFRKESDLLVDFNFRLKEILPPSKIMRLYRSNTDFKNFLLKKIQEQNASKHSK